MLESLQVLNYGFNYFLEQGDTRVKDWPLMQNPFPGCVMIAAYIYFVKVAGPQWMKKRQPFVLRYQMALYNFAMVIANLIIFLGIGWFGWFNGYSLKCQPVDYSNNFDAVMMAEFGWWFYITKFIEFADTIFFVLRKKDCQISALHVIHHSIVPFSLWFGLKFAPGGYNAFFPFLNSLVHVIMYSYYGLAALGPRFQKYLGWKKYITYIQMSQFVGVVIYAVVLLFGSCDISKTFIVMNIIHALLFFGLFFNFFRQNYGPRDSRKCQPALPMQPNGKLCTAHHVTLAQSKRVTESVRHRSTESAKQFKDLQNGSLSENTPIKNQIPGDTDTMNLESRIQRARNCNNFCTPHTLTKVQSKNGFVCEQFTIPYSLKERLANET